MMFESDRKIWAKFLQQFTFNFFKAIIIIVNFCVKKGKKKKTTETERLEEENFG